jgi:hypothetical protein
VVDDEEGEVRVVTFLLPLDLSLAASGLRAASTSPEGVVDAQCLLPWVGWRHWNIAENEK